MRAVLFDFGGTLDYPQHWLDRFLAHYQAAGVRLTRAELDPAFDAATRLGYRSTQKLAGCGLRELISFLVRHQLEFLRDPERSPVRDLASRLRGSATIEELAVAVSEAFIAESRGGLARSRDVLTGFAGRARLGVVSNFYGNLDCILDEAGFAGLFATVIDSGRLGIHKPDPAIYRAALAAIDVQASSAMMVGDSLDKDCTPAHALGMCTVWLRHRDAPRPTNPGSIPADFTITALEELKELI